MCQYRSRICSRAKSCSTRLIHRQCQREEGDKNGEWTNSFRILDERFGRSHLPLLLGDSRIPQNSFTSTLGITLPGILASVRSRRRQQIESGPETLVSKSIPRRQRNNDESSPLYNLLKRVPVSETSSSDSNIFLKTQIFDLMKNRLRIVFRWALVRIRLDRSNVGRLGAHQFLD